MDREINIKGYSENPQGTLLDWEGFTPSLVLDVLGSWGTAQWWSVCLVLMRSWAPSSGPGKQTARTPVENLRGPIRDTSSEAHFCVRKPSWGWSRRGWRRHSVPPVKSGPLYGAKAKKFAAAAWLSRMPSLPQLPSYTDAHASPLQDQETKPTVNSASAWSCPQTWGPCKQNTGPVAFFY